MRTTAYRVLGPTWGIAIDLTAEATSVPAPQGFGEQISEGLWLDVNPLLEGPPGDRAPRLAAGELGWLRHGMSLVAEEIRTALPPRQNSLVTVHRVLFPETDFQAEGLAAAIMLWSQEEFRLTAPATGVSFNRAANRFVYTWQRRQGPSEDVRTVRPTRDLLGRSLPRT